MRIPFPGISNISFSPVPVIGGVSMLTLLSGFGVCFFDIAGADTCVAYADKVMLAMKSVGDHVILWFIAILDAVFSYYPVNLPPDGASMPDAPANPEESPDFDSPPNA